MQLRQPDNAAAVEIVRLRSVNNDIDMQIQELRRAQDRNSEIIGALDLTAQWVEVEEPPAPEILEEDI